MRATTLRAVLTAGTLLTGSAAAQAQTELTFWHSLPEDGSGGQVIATLIERFEASQADTTVQSVYVGNYNDMITRLQAAVAGGNAPDLVMLEATRYGIFADRGVLEPLEPYLQATPEVLADIRPFALEASLYQGQSFVLPFNVSTPLMYYNKDLFRSAGLDPEAPPRTWAQLLEAAERLTVRDGDRTVQWGVNAPPQWIRWAMTEQNGGGWMDPATHEIEIDDQASIEAYQFAADWVTEYGVAALDAAIQEPVAKEYFQGGISAITFDSTGALGGLIGAVPFDLGVAPLPCGAGRLPSGEPHPDTCAAPIGGATLGILASSGDAEKAAAWDFLRHVMTPDSNALMFTVTGYMPILQSTTDHPDAVARIAEFPAYTLAVAQLEHAFARARPPAMPAIRQMEPSVWESIVLEEQTAEDALTEFGEEIAELLAEG